MATMVDPDTTQGSNITPDTTSKPATTFHKFLDLPTELRLTIIEIYLANCLNKVKIPPTTLYPSCRLEPAILHTSLQIRDETLKPYRTLLLSINDDIDKELDGKVTTFENTRLPRKAPWAEKVARMRLQAEIGDLRSRRITLRKEIMLVRMEIEAED